jgi:DNA-binding LacI/PurR family transcriptional regulator
MSVATRIEPVYSRIAGELRSSIAQQLRPGDMLPSEHELAKRYAIHRNTIRQAMDVLAREGLIRRHPGQGTVVLDRAATGEIAVVLRPQLFRTDAHAYYTFVTGAIIKALQERNPRWRVRLHVGQITETEEAFPSTLDLMAPNVLRDLRGVLTFHPLYEVADALHAARVPVVGLEKTGNPRVFFKIETLFTLGLAHLKEVGCRTVGVVWGAFSKKHDEENKALFLGAAKACGFEVRPDWIRASIGASITEQNGYELMNRLWKDCRHPDGVLVPDDVVCRGVLRAAMQLGVEFPRDMRLVAQASRGIALNYHKPISRVEYDPTEQSRLAVDMMMTLVEGRKPSSTIIDLPGVLIKGETT